MDTMKNLTQSRKGAKENRRTGYAKPAARPPQINQPSSRTAGM